jgi:hypothetical protein
MRSDDLEKNFVGPLMKLKDWRLKPWFLTVTGLLLLVGVLLWLRLPILTASAAPSGSDPGNWLALAWGMTGQSARLAPSAYPPLALLWLRLILVLFTPLIALKIFGFFTWVAMSIALLIVQDKLTPQLPLLFRLGLTLFFVCTSYNGEIFCFGGYPQLYGIAFLCLSIPFEEAFLSKGQHKDGLLAGMGVVGVVFTHHLLTGLLPVFWALTFLWCWLWNKSDRKIITRRFLGLSVLTLSLALFAAPWYWHYYSLLAASPFNPHGYSLQKLLEMAVYVFREMTPLWLVLLGFGMITPWINPRSRFSASTFAFVAGGSALFLVFWEVRIVQVPILGIILALAELIESKWRQAGSNIASRSRRIILVLLVGFICATGVIQGQQDFIEANHFYMVLEDDLVPAIDWLHENTPIADKVSVSGFSGNKFILGWWVEGYGQRSAYYQSETRWLSFTQEKINSTIANMIFDPLTPADVIQDLLYNNQINWIFMDKSMVLPGIKTLATNDKLIVAHEDDLVIIYKVVN